VVSLSKIQVYSTGGITVKLITYYSYYGSMADPLDALHDQAKSGADAIICRIRLCADNVPVVYKDSSVAQMCLREERVDELTFREIDALMQLGSRRILTLDRLLDGYSGDVPVILHFRGFHPDADMIHRTALSPRFLFASDSVQQIRFVADAYPGCGTVGFASHIPVAEEMIGAGARAVCLYGREIHQYPKDRIPMESDRCGIWFDVHREPVSGIDSLMESVREFGGSGIAVSPEWIR
jgi:hypothetical protein